MFTQHLQVLLESNSKAVIMHLDAIFSDGEELHQIGQVCRPLISSNHTGRCILHNFWGQGPLQPAGHWNHIANAKFPCTESGQGFQCRTGTLELCLAVEINFGHGKCNAFPWEDTTSEKHLQLP